MELHVKVDSLRMAYQMRQDGKTYQQIADALNDAGSRNQAGNEWTLQSVHYMLSKNEKPPMKHIMVKKPEVQTPKHMPAPIVPDDKPLPQVSATCFAPKNPTQAKLSLAQQILGTSDIPLARRFSMAAETLLS